MNCVEFELRLHEILDARGHAGSDPLLVAHQAGCRQCTELLRALEAALAAVAQLPPQEPAADLGQKVLARLADTPHTELVHLHREPAASQSLFRRRASFAAALAASLLLLLSPLAWLSGDRPRRPARPAAGVAHRPARAHRPAPAPGQQRTTAPRITDLASAAHDRYQGLARETGDSVSVAMQIIPGLGSAPRVALPQRPDLPASQWTSGMADGLKPVTRSTAGAVNTLLRAIVLPTEESES